MIKVKIYKVFPVRPELVIFNEWQRTFHFSVIDTEKNKVVARSYATQIQV